MRSSQRLQSLQCHGGKLAANLIIGAVGHEYWDVDMKGKAAHAGLAPEMGS